MLKCKISIKLFVLNCVFLCFIYGNTIKRWWWCCVFRSRPSAACQHTKSSMPTYQIQHAILCSSGAESTFACWVMYLCYKNPLTMEPRGRNVQELIHVINGVSESANFGRYIDCKNTQGVNDVIFKVRPMCFTPETWKFE